MRYSTLLRRYAGWGLAFGVMVACGTQDNTPPSSYGYPEDAGPTAVVNNANAPANSGSSSGAVDMSSSSGSSSGSPSSSSSGGSGQAPAMCPTSCKTVSDCASCPPAGSGAQNCCVMNMCVMMASCPVIRDSGSGRDGS